MNICAFGKTDKGTRRSNNEDAFVITPSKRYSAVADGMGGAAAGEVASRIFVDTVRELFALAQPGSQEEVTSLVREAFQVGNEKIISSAQETPEHEGMGCTAELIAFNEDRYTVGHVGDSRTYLYRGGELRQLTKDHSLVQHQVDDGIITPLQARRHAMKNVILRALGLDESLSLDIIRGRLLPLDTFLLCSDGLTDMLDDREIAGILASGAALDVKVDLLIEGALRAGGKDNVTVVLCQAAP
jgi:PPM family protein phosphatase